MHRLRFSDKIVVSLMKFTIEASVEAVFLHSKDPESLAQFYADGFGLEVAEEKYEGHWGMSVGSVYFGFEQGSESKGGDSVVVWIRVMDAASTHDRLVDLGAKSVMSPDTEGSPGEVLATVLDPAGHTIGLISEA